MEELKNKFLKKFARYTPSVEFMSALSLLEDYKVKTDVKGRRLSCDMRFSKRVKKEVLYEAADGIKAAYELNGAVIYPVFPASEFCAECTEDLILTLCKSTEKIGRGFFDGCTYEFDETNRRIDIVLRSGLNAKLLLANGADKFLRDCVRAEYSQDISFTLTGKEGEAEELKCVEEERLHLSELYRNMPPEEENNDNSNGYSGGGFFRREKPDADKVYAEYEGKSNSYAPTEGEPFEYLNDEKTIVKSGKLKFDISQPETLYGPAPTVPLKPIRSIKCTVEKKMRCAFLAKAFTEDEKESRDYKKRKIKMYFTDSDASIIGRFTIDNSEHLDVNKTPAYYIVQGTAVFDEYEGEPVVKINSLSKVKDVLDVDTAPEPRVELHLHTNMSAMDALCDPGDVFRYAHESKMKAVAVTDHGNVQAYPEIMKVLKKYPDVKPIYGMEGYLVDDTARAVFNYKSETTTSLHEDEFVVFDTETTGLNPHTCGLTEIGAVIYKAGEVIDVFETFVNPGMPIPENITRLTSITEDDVKDAPSEKEAVTDFLKFCGDRMLVAHNAGFDIGFIRRVCEDHSIAFDSSYLDTVSLSRYMNRSLKKHTLDSLRDFYNLGEFHHHRACDDTKMLAAIFRCMIDQLDREGVRTVEEVNAAMASGSDPKHLPTYHVSILVKNKDGLKNLYKIISRSYLEFFYRFPRIPKTVLTQYRDGLIIGSACAAGEFFRAVSEGKPDSELKKIASFYDYFEIMPKNNNRFLVDERRVGKDETSGYAELERINKKILSIADSQNKMTVATGDVHFMTPDDEIYRQILLSGMKFSDASRETGLYMKTTDEMLKEFSYLGDRAYEVVVTNTNKIADMIDGDIKPIPDGQYTPSIDGAEEELTECCYNKAHEMYGEDLPDIVAKRTEKELGSIIKNGFAVLYIIARKLVKNSEKSGYLVGSRGSVGSSFIATLADISEVNPLPPHYRCPKCKHSIFITDGSVGSGFDLPDRKCDKCGTLMIQDGHDIPFETFLGFHGEKAPDIDLNFSGDNQSDAHKYTEVLFGKENIFRAGTVGTVAEKTSYGYVKKYCEEKGISLTKAEEERLVYGCVGIKRTTGQHPGGIVVIPKQYQIYDFTPVQHPADKESAGVITTHFAFEYLHDTLLKLDILGHDVPTFYKVFKDYTGIDVRTIPMNDPNVIELFNSTKPLKPLQDTGCKVGALALPEITPYVMGMMQTAKPKSFAALLQISGLSHGTGIWLGNGEELIKNGTCTVDEVIGTRDSIMLYLIKKGVDYQLAFKTMESVRKGRGLTDEMKDAMIAANVPDWYIESCKKIKYLFPKSHAAAYMMGTLRLGWCKIYHPVEYYATYFTVKPEGFDGAVAGSGINGVIKKINELENAEEKAKTDEDTLNCLRLVREMLARGYEFLPVNIYKSHAKRFIPEDGKIRMPFSALVGLGETAALNIYEAMRDKKADTLEELKTVAGLNKNVIEVLKVNNCLGDFPETNQITLF